MALRPVRSSAARQWLCRALLAGATPLALLNVPLAAQSTASPGLLRGRVVEARDTIGVAVASVDVLGTSRSVTATRTGDFEIRGLANGRHTLVVRRLGYTPQRVDVDFDASLGLVVEVGLERAARALTRVVIEGKERWVPPRLEEVYWRMSHANGKFFTREDIDALNPIDVQSLLQLVPTARVSDNGIAFAKCERHGAHFFTSSVQRPTVAIWIDGMKMTGRGGDIGREQKEILAMVLPSQIQAIEVYTGVSRLPAEFLDDACAVIAIWRK